MSDTTEQGTLEELVMSDLWQQAMSDDEAAVVIHRFLQLARREGFTKGYALGCQRRPSVDDISKVARGAFPLPPVTRTVQRVEADPHGDGEWKAEGGYLFWRSLDRAEWRGLSYWSDDGRRRATPERCELWRSLLLEPTRTEVVEE